MWSGTGVLHALLCPSAVLYLHIIPRLFLYALHTCTFTCTARLGADAIHWELQCNRYGADADKTTINLAVLPVRVEPALSLEGVLVA